MFPTQPNCEEEDGVYMCSATIGASVTLVCNAAGNPSPTVTFYPSDISGNNDNNIVLSSVSMEDAGNYSCTASAQGFADVTRRFTLTVGGEYTIYLVQYMYVCYVLYMYMYMYLYIMICPVG